MLKINDWFYQDLEETTSTNDAVIEFFKKTNAPSVVCVFQIAPAATGKPKQIRREKNSKNA